MLCSPGRKVQPCTAAAAASRFCRCTPSAHRLASCPPRRAYERTMILSLFSIGLGLSLSLPYSFIHSVSWRRQQRQGLVCVSWTELFLSLSSLRRLSLILCPMVGGRANVQLTIAVVLQAIDSRRAAFGASVGYALRYGHGPKRPWGAVILGLASPRLDMVVLSGAVSDCGYEGSDMRSTWGLGCAVWCQSPYALRFVASPG